MSKNGLLKFKSTNQSNFNGKPPKPPKKSVLKLYFIFVLTHNIQSRLKMQFVETRSLSIEILETSDTAVFLRMTLWRPHILISALADKLSFAAYAVRKIRQLTDVATAKLVYFAYFRSIMLYGLLLWGKAADVVLQKTNFLVEIIHQYLNDLKLKCLMKEYSMNLLEKFIQVGEPGRTIVCRLYRQKERWFRWEELKTDFNDPTVQKVWNSLIEYRLVSVAQNRTGQTRELEFDEIAQIPCLKELIGVCRELEIKINRRSKVAVVEKLRNFMGKTNSNKNIVLKKLRAILGTCYKLTDQARGTLNELFILICLGMNRKIKKKVEVTLVDAISGRETYPIGKDVWVDNVSAVFNNRREFEQYLSARTINKNFSKTSELKDLQEKCNKITEITEDVFELFQLIDIEDMTNYIKLPVWLRPYTPLDLYVRILEKGIIELKKNKTYNLTVEILSALLSQEAFAQHKKVKWFNEKSLILDNYLGDSEGAAAVVIEGFALNLPSEAKDHLCDRAKTLAFRKARPVSVQIQVELIKIAEKKTVAEKDIKANHFYKVPMYTTAKGNIKFETETNGERYAEEQCIYEYVDIKSKYTHGFRWEGKIVITIFFLLFWDIIYASLDGLRGIFLSRYQKYPLDLFTECFYANRKLMIEERLREIEESTVEEMLANMQATWQNRPESELSGITRSIGWGNIRAVASCLGPQRVAVLCRRLATNYGYAHKGFPDLTLWNIHTKQITFVEVKTDSDNPSMGQLHWMHYMKENEIDTRFCYIGVHTRRNKSRNLDDCDDNIE